MWKNLCAAPGKKNWLQKCNSIVNISYQKALLVKSRKRSVSWFTGKSWLHLVLIAVRCKLPELQFCKTFLFLSAVCILSHMWSKTGFCACVCVCVIFCVHKNNAVFVKCGGVWGGGVVGNLKALGLCVWRALALTTSAVDPVTAAFVYRPWSRRMERRRGLNKCTDKNYMKGINKRTMVWDAAIMCVFSTAWACLIYQEFPIIPLIHKKHTMASVWMSG